MRIISVKIDTAAIAVMNNDGKILILQRGGTSPWEPYKWNFPGGGIDKGESANSAAIRECKEEAGLIPKRVKFIGNYGQVAMFLGLCDGVPRINFESMDYRWVNENDLDQYEFVEHVLEVLKMLFRSKIDEREHSYRVLYDISNESDRRNCIRDYNEMKSRYIGSFDKFSLFRQYLSNSEFVERINDSFTFIDSDGNKLVIDFKSL